VNRLPLLVSIPHAGLRIPAEAAGLCLLSRAELIADSDEGAAEIYGPLRAIGLGLVTTPISRTVVDTNRASDDRRPNGVIKIRTFQRKRVWHSQPSVQLADQLIARYWRPYHRALERLAEKARLGLDCHVMSAVGPPTAGDAGQARPRICLGVADGTCPIDWSDRLAACLERSFDAEVVVNVPFPGGYIIRSRPGGIAWVQLELSSSDWLTTAQKSERVQAALEAFFASGSALGI
jgi:formiminoglutamase